MPSLAATQTQAFSGFALRTPLSTTGVAARTDPEAAGAARLEAHAKLTRLEAQVGRIVAPRQGRICQAGRDLLLAWRTQGWACVGMLGLGVIGTGISLATTGEMPDERSVSLLALMLGGMNSALFGAGEALGRGLMRWSRDRAFSAYDADVAAIEQAAGKAEGLERLWLARRAATVRDFVPSSALGKRLDAIAAALNEAAPEVRAELEIMTDVRGFVFPQQSPARPWMERAALELQVAAMQGSPIAVAAPKKPDPVPPHVMLSMRLEHLIERVERLSPEARSLMRTEIADEVVGILNAQPGNRWRVKRFLEAFDGTRTPYTATTVTRHGSTQDNVWHLRQFGTDVLYSDASGAIDALTRAALAHDTLEAKVLVSSTETAELVAAHFERDATTRAALFEHAPTEIQVSIYHAASPPEPGFTTTAPAITAHAPGEE